MPALNAHPLLMPTPSGHFNVLDNKGVKPNLPTFPLSTRARANLGDKKCQREAGI